MNIMNCCQRRLTDLRDEAIFQSLKIIDVKTWPKEKDDLVLYGHRELSILIQHFSVLLQRSEVDTDKSGIASSYFVWRT